MTSYKDSWVDIEKWDKSSKIAYDFAKMTFPSRKWMIWQAVEENWGFAGMMDMWDFYLIQNDDWVWTKIKIAEKIWKFDTIGYDLLAMVCDDAICLWAETISISNTLDTNKVDEKITKQLLSWLAHACIEQKIIIPWWEIAELWKCVNWNVWNATSVWVVKKDKVINWKNIKIWDKIISLYEKGFRSNW
jgi:phosphoribosylformylglycinamidine cyclo-ligase